ncbi:DNA-binding transcriptional regulator, PadR family [Acinetobacter marinus]|uniref:DNA-binding transcriptional regulator, PadR family n=1 Tax=Acinetobacter marinus TaxID=281375 RepID=A0A1G6GR75_9GAMM|nr:PadR family transcriptional regulator [Acinetobacter marinus]SDB83696.1 DNA-binding transcriptional regulator, PadR family [Acinetobacter marinus]
MSLAHVLLTSLLEKPSTGIELARRFDRSMGFFWNATHQQIYRELKQMQVKGWIQPIATDDTDSRKKTYQVEVEGRTELQRWVAQQDAPSKLRDELMVKLRAEAQLGGASILPELRRHLDLHQAQYVLYQHIAERDQHKQNSTPARTTRIQHKILELGIAFELGWIDWLKEVIALLEQDTDTISVSNH